MTAGSIPPFLWFVIGVCCVATCYATLASLVYPGRRSFRPPDQFVAEADEADEGAEHRMAISVLKPLCGAEPRLAANLETLCMQTHSAYELVFGVASESDPAAAVVRRLARAYPHLSIKLVMDATTHGSNRKVANLINLVAHASHDVLVIADSDIAVEADYLERVTAPLARPDVGIVTCLYRGRCVGGGWTRMGTLFIDKWFAPSVHVANAVGAARFGFGATLALSRETLARAGGFEALRDCLADDYWLANRVRALGLKMALSEVVVTTDVTERDLSALWRRETRWMRTIRSVNPFGFAFLFVTFTTPWLAMSGLLGVSFDTSGGDLAQSTADLIVDLSTSFGLSASLLLHWRTARSWRRFWRDLPLIPLRDALSLVEWMAAWFGSSVIWRGARVPVEPRAMTIAFEEDDAAAPVEAADRLDLS